MIHLEDRESIHLIVRPHWIVILIQFSIIAILFFAPLLLLLARETYEKLGVARPFWALALFASSIYWLLLLLFLYFSLILYWLDTWVITDERIVDIEQKGLFHREVSEFMLRRVQDVTVETRGLLASLLHFGDIKVQTAGEESFTMRRAANPDQAKEVIMTLAGIQQKKQG